MGSEIKRLEDIGVDFVAVLKYRTTEEGGRSTPAVSGYIPAIKFSFSDYMTSGQQVFINENIVSPGETIVAEIKILAVDVFRNCLREGMDFDFREGPRITGTGRIIKIINETLKEVAKNIH